MVEIWMTSSLGHYSSRYLGQNTQNALDYGFSNLGYKLD